MTLEQALDKLKPFQSQVPIEALEVISHNWNDAEPVLLAELDRCIDQPLAEEHTALFLYALYLCAEMRCEAAFERYVRILRLPNLLLDVLIGDILTENMQDMLARTCAGRIVDLKALVEDETVYAFARSAALTALSHLVIAETLSHEEMKQYCIELLSQRLERQPSYAWDAAVSMAVDLHIETALPLVESAYQNGLANPGTQSFKEIKEALSSPKNKRKMSAWREKIAVYDTAHEMSFFAQNWKKEDSQSKADPTELLEEVREVRQRQSQPKFGKIGRNEPCPCGSGKKYKKCCIDRDVIPASGELLNDVDPLNIADEWIAAGYYYYEKNWSYQALTCWRHGWQEAQIILPSNIQDPGDQECDSYFAGCDFFSNWLQDYQFLIEENIGWNSDIVQTGLQFCQQVRERFSVLSPGVANNLIETTVYLLLALGRSQEAFALMDQMIQQHPGSPQGYAVLAALLSMDAQRFNLRPDIKRAQQLLLQAREHATDCEGWDIEIRLEELKEWQT